jgi:hypothetical protein
VLGECWDNILVYWTLQRHVSLYLYFTSLRYFSITNLLSYVTRVPGRQCREQDRISNLSLLRTTRKRLGATGFLSRPQPSHHQPSTRYPLSPHMSRLTTASSTTSSTDGSESLIRRSWHAMSDLLSPFSPAALAQLPKRPRRPSRYTRVNEIPDVESTEEDGQMPTVRDYHSITTVPPHVRVPKKTPTPVRVEGKVWFANERSMSWRCSLVCCLTNWTGFLSLALFWGVKIYSLDLISQYVCLGWHTCRCPLQCVKRSHSTQLCVFVCRYQRWHHGACPFERSCSWQKKAKVFQNTIISLNLSSVHRPIVISFSSMGMPCISVASP